MKPRNNLSIKSSLIITAATIGSGMFALPYVIAQSGWLLTLIYFAVLGAIITVVHSAYLKVLAQENEKERLLGLGKKYFGRTGFWFGFIGIVVGLLVSFVIFLILGTQFVQLLFPSVPYYPALFIFWLLLAIPAAVSNRREVKLALAGIISIAAIIIFVFASSLTLLYDIQSKLGGPANLHGFLAPFGIILFALAGWTGVEPFYESHKPAKGSAWLGLALGTAIAIGLYLMFASGILASTPHLTTDTISGLAAWPAWQRALLAVLGLFAIGTCSGPISHEIRNTLEKDLHWSQLSSRLTIILLPLAVVLLGFNNFLLVVGLAGGLFISMEYLLIIGVARRSIKFPTGQRLALDLAGLVFLAAAVYEILTFVIK